jgi:hypothetical protein
MENERRGRSQADELAGAVFEFFKSLYTHDTVVDDDDDDGPSITHQENVDLINQNTIINATGHQLSSPDSITVTTVFGVHEEPSHVTVISGPSTFPHHHAYAFEEVESSEIDHHDELMQGSSIATSNETDLSAFLAGSLNTPDIDSLLGIDTDSNMNDDGDDADIDTDDFDAESAVIDEFFDDGGLTPTMTTHGSDM